MHLLSTQTDFRKTRPVVFAAVEMKLEFIAHPFSLFKQIERYSIYCQALCLCNKKQYNKYKKNNNKKNYPQASMYYHYAIVIRCCKNKTN